MKANPADWPVEFAEAYFGKGLTNLTVECDPRHGRLWIVDGHDEEKGFWRDRWVRQPGGKFKRLARLRKVGGQK